MLVRKSQDHVNLCLYFHVNRLLMLRNQFLLLFMITLFLVWYIKVACFISTCFLQVCTFWKCFVNAFSKYFKWQSLEIVGPLETILQKIIFKYLVGEFFITLILDYTCLLLAIGNFLFSQVIWQPYLIGTHGPAKAFWFV